MTDINEIIGRALLALDGTGHKREGMAMDSGWDVRRILLDGTWLYTDIGAAVVKALGEAGYEITEIEPAEIHLTEAEKNAQMRAMLDRMYEHDEEPPAGINGLSDI